MPNAPIKIKSLLPIDAKNIDLPQGDQYPVYVKDSTTNEFKINNGAVYSNKLSEWLNSKIKSSSDYLNKDFLPEESCSNVVNESVDFLQNKFLRWVNGVKDTVASLLSSKTLDSVGSWICKQASTTFEALLTIIKALLYYPLLILRLLRSLVKKILELLESAVMKIFKCIDSMIDSLFKRLNNISIASLFKSLKALLIACDYVSKPILWMMNGTFETVLPPLRRSIGFIDDVLKARSGPDNPTGEIFNFESSKDAIDFLNTIIYVFEQDKDKLLNSPAIVNVLKSYDRAKKNIYKKMKEYIATILKPFFVLERMYNNLLNTRSRFLAKWIVNPLIGWLLPKYSMTGERIYRSRYSIIDLIKIAEGMTKCSSYVCKANEEYNKKKLEMIYDKLCIGRTGKWYNPFQVMKTSRSILSRALNDQYVEDGVSSSDYLISTIMNSSITELTETSNFSNTLDGKIKDSKGKKNKNPVSDSIVENEGSDINLIKNAALSEILMYRQMSLDSFNVNHNEYFERYRYKELYNRLGRTLYKTTTIDKLEELVQYNLTPNNNYEPLKEVENKIIEGKGLLSDIKKYAVSRSSERIEQYQYELDQINKNLSLLGISDPTNITSILRRNPLLIRQYGSLPRLVSFANELFNKKSILEEKISLENIKIRFLREEVKRFTLK